MPYETKELRERRFKLVQDANALLTKANAEKRQMSKEESEKFDAMHNDADALRVEIERMERANKAEADLQARTEPAVGRQDQRAAGDGDSRTAEQRAAQDKAGEWDRFRRYLMGDNRALSSSNDALGGVMVPTSVANQVFEVQKTMGGMAAVSTVIRTSSGETITYPVWDDTGNLAQIEGESDALASNVDPGTGEVEIPVYKFSSNIIKVPFELLQDAQSNLEQLLTRSIAVRIARKTNAYWTTGDGTGEPNGVITAATVGKTVAATNAITAAELISFMHSVDPIYRSRGAWMMSDTVLATIRSLTDSYGQLMWQISLRENAPDTLLGKPVVINNDMAGTLQASALPIAFGDWSSYYIRIAGDLRVRRLNELYAENDQVGFVALGRYGGNLLYVSTLTNAALCPIRTLKMATA